MASLITQSMHRGFVCLLLLLLLIVSCSGTGHGHAKNMGKQSASKHPGSRKLSEKKTSSNSTVAKPTDIGVGTPAPPNPYITTPTTPTLTPTTPTVTPTTPTITPPTTPVTTPTTPGTTPTPTTSGQSWCVAKTNVPDKSLQTALDYACGLGGADCRAIVKGGPCFDPNTVAGHASYAFNNYFQKNNMAPGTCDFGGNAILTQTNPSYGTCIYTTGSSTSTPTTPGITPATPTTPGVTPTTPTPPTTTTPVSGTPPGGITTAPPGSITTAPPGSIITSPPGITGGLPNSFGPTASLSNTTYSGSSSSLEYLGSSFTFLMSVSVAVILG